MKSLRAIYCCKWRGNHTILESEGSNYPIRKRHARRIIECFNTGSKNSKLPILIAEIEGKAFNITLK
ncbi:MAG: hypothetical protein AYK18_03055 [Theionarchaea archaeon DG-70]|nr:MAG: hypothetical protein AYK18_03055 [Theionarchaea archaeon DG-70]